MPGGPVLTGLMTIALMVFVGITAATGMIGSLLSPAFSIILICVVISRESIAEVSVFVLPASFVLLLLQASEIQFKANSKKIFSFFIIFVLGFQDVKADQI